MGPVAPHGRGAEVERSGVGEDVGGRRRIGDEAAHVGAQVAIGAIEPCALVMASDQRTAQQVDPALEAAEVAARARVGVRLVVVVDRLSEEPAPDRGRKERARRRPSLLGWDACRRAR
jgi:hypothetical protein